VSCKSCCCAHTHSSSCKWQKYATKFGYEKAHNLHSGKCNCNLSLNRHNTNCEVYQDFMTFLREYKDPEEVKQGGGLWDFDADFDFEENLVAFDQKEEENIICCCKKDLPHDESIKFILKAN
jgi:hypothetical protein